jgi:hypothetical protein
MPCLQVPSKQEDSHHLLWSCCSIPCYYICHWMVYCTNCTTHLSTLHNICKPTFIYFRNVQCYLCTNCKQTLEFLILPKQQKVFMRISLMIAHRPKYAEKAWGEFWDAGIFLFMLVVPCITKYRFNNQLDAQFVLSLLNYHTSTCFGHINSRSSGGWMYVCGKWYLLYF